MNTRGILTKSLQFIFIVILCSGLAGCGMIRGTIQRVGICILDTTILDLVDKIMDTKSGTMVQNGLAGDILLITGITELSPKNYKLLAQCALLYGAYGLFIEDENPELASELYTIGKSYGVRALCLNKKFRKGYENGDKIPALVKYVDEDYIEAVTWTALNHGLYLILNMDDPMVLINMPDVVALAERSTELQEDYFYGVGMLVMAAYYSIVPEFLGLGGGPESALKTFDKAATFSDGNLLLVDVFKARFYAPVIKDSDLFDSLLEDVLKTDSSVLKGGALLNELAKIKAKYYLEHKDDFF